MRANLEEKYKTQLKWFQDRIGKRIYRNKVACDCETCNSIESEGLIIYDDTHASYLNDCSAEMNIKYRDNK